MIHNRQIHQGKRFWDGFSLVEVTIAIGIFAFVVVGVMGLLPAGLRMRADSSSETRGVLIAEELFAAVRAAPTLAEVNTRKGPGQRSEDNTGPLSILDGKSIVFGYPSQTTMPYYWFRDNPDASWTNASGSDAQVVSSAGNAVDTMARLTARKVSPGVYNVSVEVRAPASLPLTNCRPSTFSTLIYSP